MVTITRYITGISQIIAGLVSLAISVWQYQHDSGGITISFYDPSANYFSKSFSDTCTMFPYEYLRRNTGYCGYGDANTAYRISVAGVTFLFGVLFFFQVVENHRFAVHWTLFGLVILWFCATVVDVYAIINGQQGCKDGFGSSSYGRIDCNNAIYGVTCAIDFGVSTSMLFLWIFDGYMNPPPSINTSAGTNTVSLSQNIANPSAYIKV